MGGARRLARVRDAGRRRRGSPGTPASSAASGRVTASPELIPLARPVIGGARRSAGARRCCAPGSCRWGRWLPRVRAGVRRPGRRSVRERGLERDGRSAPGAAGGRRQRRRRGRHDARSRSSRARTSSLYERARPVFADIDPVTLNLDPEAAAAAVTDAHDGAAARPRVRLPGRHRRVRARSGCRSSRTPARRSAPSSRTGGRSAAAAIRRCSASTPNKQLTTGEGGSSPAVDAALKERIDSERNQGRAPDMGWLDHDRLGFNYRLSDIACALGLAQLQRLDAMLAGRDGSRGHVSRGARAEIEGLALPCADTGGARRGWFVFVVQLPRGVDRDETVRALGAHGCPEQAVLPGDPPDELTTARRFGHREGEFPVCEDVAARSIALPFFPGDDRGPRSRASAAALRAVLGPRRIAALMSRFSEPQDDAFRRLNDSIWLRLAARALRRRSSRVAHAAMLAAQGIISDADRDELLAALEQVARRAGRRHVPVRRRATRTSTWRSNGG